MTIQQTASSVDIPKASNIETYAVSRLTKLNAHVATPNTNMAASKLAEGPDDISGRK